LLLINNKLTKLMNKNKNLDQVASKFFEIESNLAVFNIYENNMPIWEYIRPMVATEIRDQHVSNNSEEDPQRTRLFYAKYLKNLLKNTVDPKYSIFNIQNSEVLIDGFGRRTYRDDHKQWDTILDPIADTLTEKNISWTFFERPSYGCENFHYNNIYTNSNKLAYTDFIHLFPKLIYKSGFFKRVISNNTQEKILDVFNKISNDIGIEIDSDLLDDINQIITEREIQLKIYDRLINRVQPDVLIYSSKYKTRPLIEICKSEDIPVVEVQHGIVDTSHLTINYPTGSNPDLFPDHFLTWGQYWSSQITCKKISTHVIGNFYSDEQYKKSSSIQPKSKDRIVFISQPFCGNHLANIARNLSNQCNKEIFFKPHPGTETNWEKYYPQLVNTTVRIPNRSKNLYDILASAQAQVGVSSTALFEGLRFNLDTYIIDYFTSSYLNQIVEEGYAVKAKSSDDLIKKIDSYKFDKIDNKRWFAPYRDEKAYSVIQNIIDS